MRKYVLTVAAAVLAIACSPIVAVAGADPPRPEPVAVAVPYGDLDISNSAGVAKLTVRMKMAMEAVCGERPNPKLIERTEAFITCRASLATADPDPAVRAAFQRARDSFG